MASLQPILKKYPRTRHIESSRFQHGDHDLEAVAFKAVQGQFMVVEEKVDGANCGVSFDDQANLLLQSRGHYLVGGPRERHFNLLKTWAAARAEDLYLALGERYVMYGEWMYAKHTCFYDRLPHHFMEFDIYDREQDLFLSTARRRELLRGTPVVSVPVVHEGTTPSIEALARRVAPSLYKSDDWWQALCRTAADADLDVERVERQTDPSPMAEGLYVKVEEDGVVTARYKWIRASFLTSVVDSGGHWIDRPIVPNRLAPGVDIYDPGQGDA